MEAREYGTYSAIQSGDRGLVMTIPKVFFTLNGLSPGSPLVVYLVPDDPSMLIVRVPENSDEQTTDHED